METAMVHSRGEEAFKKGTCYTAVLHQICGEEHREVVEIYFRLILKQTF